VEADVRENDGGEMSLESAYAAVNGHGESVEAALWTALRVLQERAEIGDRLAERVGKAGAERSRKRFEAVAEEARRQAGTIHRLLAGPGGPEG
jgi:two-component system chemotaxis response regulator CheB